MNAISGARAAAVMSRLAWPLAPVLLGAALSALVTGWLIPRLRSRQLGKAIRSDGPAHQSKAGTPTLGGLAIIAAWLVTLALCAVARSRAPCGPAWRAALAAPVLAIVGYGALGLLDDIQGLARRSAHLELGVGLTARRALALQLALAAGLGWLIGPGPILAAPSRLLGLIGPGKMDAGPIARALAVTIAMAVLAGAVNGVNIADGLDGLAAGLSAIAFAGMAVSATLIDAWPVQWGAVMACWPASDSFGGLNAPAPALLLAGAGACLGFLVHNRHPARIFMGNVGSMALGAALATTALATGTWWLLPIVGLVFVAEIASDLIQVGYFKATHGRRLFRMAPLHHHFELGGWSEVQVVHRFWAVGAAAALLGIAVSAAAVHARPPGLGDVLAGSYRPRIHEPASLSDPSTGSQEDSWSSAPQAAPAWSCPIRAPSSTS